jgi:hypothetical protein
MSSDGDDGPEEDPRIATLYAKADKLSPEEFGALVLELGGKDAVVLGGMLSDKRAAMAHFVVHALMDVDDGTLAECVIERRKLLKGFVDADAAAAGEGGGKNLIAALEGFVCNEVEEGAERASAEADFRAVLQALWEHSVVSEDEIRAWQADERAGRLFKVGERSAISMHDRGRLFLEWVDRGEE